MVKFAALRRSGWWRFPVRDGGCPFATPIGGTSAGLMILTATAPGVQPVLVERFGFGWADLAAGRVGRLVTNCVVPPRAGLVASNLIVPAVVLVLAERRFGTARVLRG